MVEPVLKVEHLSVSFKGNQALRDLGFQVQPGQIVGLLGPNGSGKSTGIAALLGLVRASCEAIAWKGVPTTLGSRAIRRDSGVLLQAGSTDPKLTVQQNLKLSGQLYGLSENAIAKRVEEWLSFFDLSNRAKDPVGHLSGGMTRKVEFARALLHEPRHVFLDEPTTGFDETSYQKSWDRLLSLRKKQGMSILLTTHRPEEAELCDHIVLLDQGRMVTEGSPQALIQTLPGDIVYLECNQPKLAAATLETQFQFKSLIIGNEVQVTIPEGHRFIPRIMESLPEGSIQAISMHRPTLADVFVHHTKKRFHQRRGEH